MRLGTIRARQVWFSSTAGVNWLKGQDSQFRQPGSCRARTASSPVRCAQLIAMNLKLAGYIVLFSICSCSDKTRSPVLEKSGLSDISNRDYFISLLKGEWVYEDDPYLVLKISKDSLYHFYKNIIEDRSAIVLDSNVDLDKHLSNDSSFDFTNSNDIWGLKVFKTSRELDPTEFLIIYVDKKSLEIGDHNGSHRFHRRYGSK